MTVVFYAVRLIIYPQIMIFQGEDSIFWLIKKRDFIATRKIATFFEKQASYLIKK